MPIETRIGAAPLRAAAQFVAQIRGDYPALLFVATHDAAPIREPFFFGIFRVVPETIAIVIFAAPVGVAHVIVENDEDVSVSECVDYGVHNFKRVFPLELRVRFYRVVWDDGVPLERFIGPGQSHGVHANGMNLLNDGLERREIQPTGYEFLLIEAVPVY